MNAIQEIAAERQRQIRVEGYDATHDDQHPGEMARAAACYALHAVASDEERAKFPAGRPCDLWPWSADAWNPKDPRRDLVRANALLLAELDCLDRTRMAFAAATNGDAPTLPGTLFAGGFYGGRIVIDGKTYALVVAPKAEGQKILPWKNEWTSTPGTQSLNDGFANSEAMNNSEHPAAQFCRGVTIAGFTDWYLPSRDELEVLYRNLKPTSYPNYTSESRLEDWDVEPGEYNGADEHGNGHNASSAPAGGAYTTDTPAQTIAAAFREGGAEAFDARWYLSSTEFSPDYAWGQNFDDGNQGYYGKDDGFRCRAVRKVLI